MAESERPNIILVNCDDLGYGDLGCYGSTKNKTPALDRMAREGLRLTDFYMPAPICSPSRGGMLTGCYPPRVGFGAFNGQGVLFPGDDIGLSTKETTIPSLLKKAGYDTKMIGKWHCGDQKEFLPTRHGFDEYYGLPYSNDMGRQSNNLKHPPLPLLWNEEVIQEQPDQAGITERYAEQAVEFIGRKRSNPFFLYFAHMYVHVPIFVPERFMKQSTNGPYGDAVECIDWTMAVIFAELEKRGLDENTLVIFTSDNGSRARDEGGSNAPFRGTKQTSWEGGIRVPCILRWPGKIKAGRISRELATAMDFLPTIATFTQATFAPAGKIDGMDMGEHFLGRSPTSGRDTFAYYFRNDLRAVRQGDWKLHVATGDECRPEPMCALYNLRKDPGETTDCSASEPERLAELSALADRFREDIGDERLGFKGRCREPGRVDKGIPLTTYNENHPYMVAMYDLEEGRTMCG